MKPISLTDHRPHVATSMAVVVGLALLCNTALSQFSCAFVESSTLALPDPGAQDGFGGGVALSASGAVVAVGAIGHSHVGIGRGVVFVSSTTGAFVPVELESSSGLDWMRFGHSVDLNDAGEVLIAGAPSSAVKPRAFVFRRSGSNWVEEWATPEGLWDQTGRRVCISGSGDLAAVAAPGRTNPATGNIDGAVDIYRHDASGWTLERVVASSGLSYFGFSTALSSNGDVLIAAGTGGSLNGSVSVHRRNGGTWDREALLHELVSHSGTGGFGSGVAIDAIGETVAIGCYGDYRMGYQSGAVFVFERGLSGWSMVAEFVSPIPAVSLQLGWSIAMNAAGDRVVAGAPGYGWGSTNPGMVGAVFEYERIETGWQQVAVHLAATPSIHSSFGYSVATNATGRSFVAGALTMSTPYYQQGSAHIFDSPCTQPAVYCTAQVNSLGCAPKIDSIGNPSGSSSTGFHISASALRNQRSGLLFYGTDGALSSAWQGGWLCVRPPLRRTPVMTTGGSPIGANDCSGSLTIDFNSRIASGVDPELFAGQHVFAQFYSRDPSPASSINLTDALEFYIEP